MRRSVFTKVLPWQRWTMGALYFGLIVFLMIGMELTHLDRSMQRSRRRAPEQEQYELPEQDTGDQVHLTRPNPPDTRICGPSTNFWIAVVSPTTFPPTSVSQSSRVTFLSLSS